MNVIKRHEISLKVEKKIEISFNIFLQAFFVLPFFHFLFCFPYSHSTEKIHLNDHNLILPLKMSHKLYTLTQTLTKKYSKKQRKKQTTTQL